MEYVKRSSVFGSGRNRLALGNTSPAQVPTVDFQIATSTVSIQVLNCSLVPRQFHSGVLIPVSLFAP
jgi:hypothetical protein